ncbi:MAG: MCE family protein [Oleiphilaceae bacterium]|nr:MCE family protein [Oleiphilaceae bacterium]
MSDDDVNKTEQSPPPAEPEVRERRWHLPLVWIVPLVAVIVGLSMMVRAWQQSGPVIEITFETAEGLKPNQTPVQYRNVVIGNVTGVSLGEARQQVVATVELSKEADAFTREDTRFWVVRPRIGATGISGLGTLFSGDFIAADPGNSSGHAERFEGLESPPPITYGEPGKRFQLQAEDLGSLTIGSPVYYRSVQVGQVVSYQLDKQGNGVNVEVFVSEPHDRFVSGNTRFWNTSGLDLDLGVDGVQVHMQSLVSLVTGGIAFGTPLVNSLDTMGAEEDSRFRLFDDRGTALAPEKGEPERIRMRFAQSLRGLEEGAPVDFQGKNIGEVSRITLDYDESDQTFPVVVDAIMYPKLMGRAYDKFQQSQQSQESQNNGPKPSQSAIRELFETLVGRGLRAEARTANLLTGKLFIALEFYPDADKTNIRRHAQTMVIPTRTTSLDRIQAQLTTLVDRISKIPIESISANLDGSLRDIRQTLTQMNDDVLPASLATLEGIDKLTLAMGEALGSAAEALGEDSPQREQLQQALTEVERMSRSVRSLSDYFRRHPEALIRGRQERQNRDDLRP